MVDAPVSAYRAGVRAGLPLAFAVFAFGVSYGVLARSAGMGRIAPVVMSATTFAGSSQFAVASILSAGGGLTAGVVAAILLNGRYGPIGLSVGPYLSASLPIRFMQSQLVVDESWAVGHKGGGVYDRGLVVGTGIALYIGWVGGTIVGVSAGELIGDPRTLGLDAAFPALFLALLAPQLRSRRALTAALAGATIALALVPLARPGVPVITSSAACLIGLRLSRDRWA